MVFFDVVFVNNKLPPLHLQDGHPVSSNRHFRQDTSSTTARLHQHNRPLTYARHTCPLTYAKYNRPLTYAKLNRLSGILRHLDGVNGIRKVSISVVAAPSMNHIFPFFIYIRLCWQQPLHRPCTSLRSAVSTPTHLQ